MEVNTETASSATQDLLLPPHTNAMSTNNTLIAHICISLSTPHKIGTLSSAQIAKMGITWQTTKPVILKTPLTAWLTSQKNKISISAPSVCQGTNSHPSQTKNAFTTQIWMTPVVSTTQMVCVFNAKIPTWSHSTTALRITHEMISSV